uniref:2-hydroxyflavanone C-glucosyltransferase n=1 Tax=Fagopyrum esculentum TaxID=3617 RepID=A0A0A1HAN8_FAGES|nr:UDP-glycose: glycosyltransferase UGT89G1 [Fagopyrum esculentum]
MASFATHILVIPFPGQGHIAPLLDFTHHLLLHATASLTVTVVVTPKNLQLLQPLLSFHPSTAISALVLPLPPHPSLPSGAENTKDLPPDSFLSIFAALPGLQGPLLRWFATHPSPPSAIISDLFLGWTHHLAEKLSIKRFVFSPSAAFAMSMILCLQTNPPPLPKTESGEIDLNAVVSINDAPGRPEFFFWQLLMPYKMLVSSDGPNPPLFKANYTANHSSWGYIINTFTGLESVYLNHVKTSLGHDRVWAVGPLFLPTVTDDKVRSDPVSEHILSWLDTCQDSEVVYVSFGTQNMLTQEQVNVLALGLEKSGIRFVWKFKEPSLGHVDGHDLGKIPHGFEDRVAGRGLVIRDWVSQVLILNHRAVGSFLSHCGWNSILEGLVARVMILTWPLGADQYYNAKLLVDILKVGVRISQPNEILPNSDHLAKVLRESVSQSAYKEERTRAMQLGKEAIDSMSKDGSSYKDLEMLVQHLIQLPKPMLSEHDKNKWIEES